MTIFFDLARFFLIQRITEIHNKSSAADNSLRNTLVSRASLGLLGRNTSLSQIKRNLAKDLISELKQIEGENNDTINLQLFKKFIEDYRKKAEKESKNKNCLPGHFESAMGENLSFLTAFFEKSQLLNIINIPKDKDPLHIFYYFALFYFGLKLNKLTIFEQIARNPRITTCSQLSTEKAECLVKHVEECRMDLETIRTDLPNYDQVRKIRVLECLNKLRRENEQLCENHKKFINIPVRVGGLSTVEITLPAMKPELGDLGKIIEKARTEINKEPELAIALTLQP